MHRLAILLLLAACAPAAPRVTTSNAPPTAERFAVEGDSPAAAELRRQLEGRGLYAPDAAIAIRAGFAAAPRQLETCMAIEAATTNCTAWLDPPHRGFAPFAPPLRYRLTLELGGSQIIVSKPGAKSEQPLPTMVSAALDRLTAR